MEQLHQPGDIIASRYRIIDTLGQGGNGTTYLVEDININQDIALKALSLQRMSDWKSIELFEREARILSGLKNKAIPQYLDYFQTDTDSNRCFYIAQQLAPGKSLASLVESGWHTNESIVRSIAIEILEILVYLHSQSPPVIHRDIKPQNLIRSDNGQVYLVDFGAVQEVYYNTFMRGSTVVGTYGYMAPEQFRGQAVPTTDLYGLGATLLFLLTHRSPADLPTDRLKIDFRSRVQISEEFADWLEKMLEPDVEDRFPSASEALAVLRGKRMVKAKSGKSIHWKALVGVGVATIAAVSEINAHKYALFNYFGIDPKICTAIAHEKIDILRDYLNQVGNLSDNDRSSLLRCAVVFGKQDTMALLIDKGANVNAKYTDGNTPLWLTARRAKEDAVALLIAKGADVNAKNLNGDTPLLAAAEHSNTDALALLIAKGADVNAKNLNGDTPLLVLAAAEHSNNDALALLIAKGADVNAKNINNNTPLLAAAAEHSNKDAVALLIAKGADVNAKNLNGDTPLLAAAMFGNKYVVALLIAKSADVNARDNYGYTPLLAAAEHSNNDALALLIAKGADVNAKNLNNDTPLLAAAEHRNNDALVRLIAKGADVNAKNLNGDTPLMAAAGNGNKDAVALLIAKGADVNAKNLKGYTPLIKARMSRNTDIIQLVRSHGAH